ncbi:hypothetical protein EZS27_017396 [termite gut metagenome]|uniref:Lipopolysaccharide assembly protein B n=1 Tax=termite gut metagenome TaxID=433724 RepID=A0A5J4RLL9_9ZZZZ
MIKKLLYLPLCMAVIMAISSCSGKLAPLTADLFTVTPSVLEVTGGKVPVTISGNFPQSYFKKKAVLEITPVLKWQGGEARGKVVTFQGEKIQGNNQVISYVAGGNFTIKDAYDYIPQMAKSELILEFAATVGTKTISLPSLKIADGVISTSTLVTNTVNDANTALSSDAFQRIIKEAQQANILFLIQQANIRASELNSASIKDFNKQVKDVNAAENKKISNIEISAYASPDGSLSLNTGLAKNRETNTESYVNKQLKSSKINDILVDSKYTAEDWQGFQELVSKSNIQDKELILRVLSMYSDPEQREREIKNISSVYKTLADEILPQLRRSRLTLNYEIIGKSDGEISNLAATDASKLNIEELLYAATLTNDNAKKEAIYTKATQQFSNDYRAYNNLGTLAYKAGAKDKAETFYKKAASIKAAAEINLNLALLALSKGDVAAAESYLGKASGANYLNEALGNLYIASGQYERAVSSLGNSKTNSAALAQILTKDYNRAKSTLDAVTNPNATTDYLNAIIGARTNNTTLLTSSLRKAVQKDRSWASRAVTDIEFDKYRTSSDFADIIR